MCEWSRGEPYYLRGLTNLVLNATFHMKLARAKHFLSKLPWTKSPCFQVVEVKPSSLARSTSLASPLVIFSLMVLGWPRIGFPHARHFCLSLFRLSLAFRNPHADLR